MKKLTVIVMSLVVLGLLVPRTIAQAEDSTLLSYEDEQAYQQACASWMQEAEVNEAIGLPPFGEKPERSNFIGTVEKQEEQSQEAALFEA